MRPALVLALLAFCARPAVDGPDGSPGSACSFSLDGTGGGGVLLLSCEDGSLAAVRKGRRGPPGDDGVQGGRGTDAASSPVIAPVVEVAPLSVCPAGGLLVSLAGDSALPVCRPAPACPVVYGDVTLSDPLRLVTFAGAGCAQVKGTLAIDQVGGPRSLPSFRRERWTVGTLRIRGNRDLRTLDGLEFLGGVLDELTITGNSTLVSLEALQRIDGVRGPFTVTGNPFLPRCEAERLRDRIGPERIAGPVVIEGTADPCER